ncbi:MAG TPA: hypothetical protein VF018_12705 [Acidobacteriaceae bacterium]
MTDQFENPPSDGGFHLSQVDEPTNYGRLAVRIVIALVISSLAILIWIQFGRKTPVASGDIARLSIYPVQAKITGGNAGAPGQEGQDEIINQLLVFAHVRLHNPNTTPITLEDDWAVVTLPNGETRRSLGASGPDFEKVFQAYPQLAPLRMDPLRRDIQIQPGQSVDGLMVFSYPISREQWDARKSMQVTVSFNGAKDITLAAPPS